MASSTIARFLDDYLHNLKDKRLELKRDEESQGNSPSADDCSYLVEKYKASLDYFIQDLQAAVDRLPQNNAPVPAVQGNANNNPSNQSNSNINNASNNPRGGKRKHKNRTKKHRKSLL
jgi:hypothetical protein